MNPISPSSHGSIKHRSAAVAEQHARRPVGVVGHPRIRVRAAHQHLLMRPALHQFHARLQRKHKPRAARADTSNPHAPFAPILSCTRHAVDGNIMSGVTVPTMMHSTSRRRNPPRRQAFLRRLRADIAHAQPLGQHMPLADSRPTQNPLVVGVHQSFRGLDWSIHRGDVGAQRRDLCARAHNRANSQGSMDFSSCRGPLEL